MPSCARACASPRHQHRYPTASRHCAAPALPSSHHRRPPPYVLGRYDELAHVNGLEANAAAAALAKCEGIFTGTSGGGLVHCALERAKSLPAGSNVVVMLPGAPTFLSWQVQHLI